MPAFSNNKVTVVRYVLKLQKIPDKHELDFYKTCISDMFEADILSLCRFCSRNVDEPEVGRDVVRFGVAAYKAGVDTDTLSFLFLFLKCLL